MLLCWATGGRIEANRKPADFSQNLTIQTNVIKRPQRTKRAGYYFGYDCILSKYAEQPIREEALLTGAPGPQRVV